MTLVTQPYVLMMDDDILLEPGCLQALWEVMEADPRLGGVTATIVNETYTTPGTSTLRLLRWLDDGRERQTYAGSCIGPAMTFWPAIHEDGPTAVAIDWMSTGCSLFRSNLLPQPPFPEVFVGPSPCEDLALSLTIGRHATLAQATRAKCTHLRGLDSPPPSLRPMAKLEALNRCHIMTAIQGSNHPSDYLKLAAALAFRILGTLRQKGLGSALQVATGYLHGAFSWVARTR